MILLVAVFALVKVALANYQTFTLRYSADPAPLVVNGELFIYTSHDTADQVGWLMRDYNCFSTKDGVNFEDHGIVFTLDNSTWGTYAWAQQVTALGNGSYVMYYPAMQGSLDVGVAISEDPRGPFRDVLGHGIAPGDDPTIFQEVDGTAYLCSNNGGGPFVASSTRTWSRGPGPRGA